MSKHGMYLESVMDALNPQSGRPVIIRGELGHAEVMIGLEELARSKYGAGPVHLLHIDPKHDEQIVRAGNPFEIDVMYDPLRALYRECVAARGSMMRVVGPSDPYLETRLQADCPDAFARWREAQGAFGALYRDHGINRGQCTWLVAPAAQDGWARDVYPELGDGALAQLWEDIYDFTWADSDDPARERRLLDDLLHRRCQALNGLGTDYFHVEGPGTDLMVGLHELARFRGGGKETVDGHRFNANTPSVEVWVTPQKDRVHGTLAFTMPFLVDGVVVRGLHVTFENGAVVDSSADEGHEAFEKHIGMDAGARHLGEFALVGIDSPVYRKQRLYKNTLIDENGAGHVAFGNGYADCIEGGQEMTPAQLASVGCNKSKNHTDGMWGSDQVSVTAHTRGGDKIPVLTNGEWEVPFAA